MSRQDTTKLEFYEEKSGFADYQRLWSVDGVRVYRLPELHTPEMEAVILEARKRWRAACEKYLKTHGDRGSCVLGNGLAIAVKPPKARSVYKLLIASPLGQAESAGYATKDPIIEYLKENGIDCWYECGRMD